MKEKFFFSIGALLLSCAFLIPVKGPETPKTKVGTFDRIKVLPAFYKSEHWEQRMKRIKDDQEGQALQDRAHKQLSGEIPIPEVLEPLAKEWASIAKEAGVALIVEKPIFQDETIELVDVSDRIAAKYAPHKKRN